MGIAVLIIVIAVVVIFPVTVYNALVRLKQRVENAWAQIDVQLKRRHDLIPNLVEVAKGYMSHERETLESVIKARQQAVDAASIKDKGTAENFLTRTLRSLFAVSENYPNLKADAQMRQLHEELISTENKISFARQHYNDEVMNYNTSIKVFPQNLIAGLFNFGDEEFFEIEDLAQKEAPRVDFGK